MELIEPDRPHAQFYPSLVLFERTFALRQGFLAPVGLSDDRANPIALFAIDLDDTLTKIVNSQPIRCNSLERSQYLTAASNTNQSCIIGRSKAEFIEG